MRGCTCRGGLTLCDQCAQLAARAVDAPPARLVGGLLTPGQVQQVTERVFQAAVIRLAKERGWLVHFAHDSRKSPAGYPDLTLARMPRPASGGHPGSPGQLVIAELKVDAPLTIEQEVWLATLSHVTQTRTFLWKPEALTSIREILC